MNDNITPASMVLGKHWLAIVLAFVVCAGVGYFVSNALRKVYRAEVTVVPSRNEVGSMASSGLGAQLGGLAALTGLSLGASSNRDEYLEILRSSGLARDFIQRESLVQLICCKRRSASDGRNAFTHDELEWAVRRFRGAILAVKDDRLASVVRVSITWPDAKRAADLANAFVDLANMQIRESALREVRVRSEFLRREALEAETVELRQAIYQLLESQIKTEMIANSQSDYAFRVVDRAVPPATDSFVRPMPVLTGLLAGLAGTTLAGLWFLGRGSRKSGLN
jgi:uncharacterized protein involved in exopolysaccharide biosynthesis